MFLLCLFFFINFYKSNWDFAHALKDDDFKKIVFMQVIYFWVGVWIILNKLKRESFRSSITFDLGVQNQNKTGSKLIEQHIINI